MRGIYEAESEAQSVELQVGSLGHSNYSYRRSHSSNGYNLNSSFDSGTSKAIPEETEAEDDVRLLQSPPSHIASPFAGQPANGDLLPSSLPNALRGRDDRPRSMSLPAVHAAWLPRSSTPQTALDDDVGPGVGILGQSPKDRQWDPDVRRLRRAAQCLTALLLIAAGLAIAALVLSIEKQAPAMQGATPTAAPTAAALGLEATVSAAFSTPQAIGAGSAAAPISRIGFGAATAFDVREQAVWQNGVILAAPDAWVWTGDMAYLDMQAISCAAAPGQPGCSCNATWLGHPPGNCAAADLSNAYLKWDAMLMGRGYTSFLDYMCSGHTAKGQFPPPGSDPTVCPKPIMGIYDDHDIGWNHANRRLPGKAELKAAYLDAIGEPQDSHRRNSQAGAQWAYLLNQGQAGREVGVVLLDERYDRAPLPVDTRVAWCQNVFKNPRDDNFGWCQDFLITGAYDGRDGSSCKADNLFFQGWCAKASNRLNQYWNVACNVSSPQYGSQHVVIDRNKFFLREPNPADPRDWEESSTFCEVLGLQQRQWLEATLAAPALQQAAVKILVSPNVLLGNPKGTNSRWNGQTGVCTGDDWDCYRPAQLNLLHTIARHNAGPSPGCWIVLSGTYGDFAFADIKVLQPGSASQYAAAYQTADYSHPLYQVMSAGMTESTSVPLKCTDQYVADPSGLRVTGNCSYISVPNFGMLDIDWQTRVLSMQIRDATKGENILQEMKISLDTCAAIQ